MASEELKGLEREVFQNLAATGSRGKGEGADRLKKGQRDPMVKQHLERKKQSCESTSRPGIPPLRASLTCTPADTPYVRDEGRCSGHQVPTHL